MNLMIHVKYDDNYSFIFNKNKYLFQVVQQLMDEYRAATTKDYVNFGNIQSGQVRKVICNSFLFFLNDFLLD